MIIDLHTNIWSSVDQLGPDVAERLRNEKAARWGQHDATPEAHQAAMDGVDGSAVLGFRSQLLGANVPNELVAEYVSRQPDRRFGIAGIDPMADDAMDQFDVAQNLGLVGVTISPACQGFHPSNSRAMRVYERCIDAGMPIFVGLDHPLTSSSRLDFARPVHWDDVAREFPKLPIVISQLGHPWIDETLLLLSKHPSLYADLSGVVTRPWQLYNALLSASSIDVMGKLLFGSGFPRELPTKAIEALYSVNAFSQGSPLPSVPRSRISGIVERDALSLLGIDATVTPRRTGEDDATERSESTRSTTYAKYNA